MSTVLHTTPVGVGNVALPASLVWSSDLIRGLQVHEPCADTVGMQRTAGNWLAAVTVLVVLAAAGVFFAFGRSRDGRTVDLSAVHYYSPAVVRNAFGAHGIQLRYASAPDVSPGWLSAIQLPVPTTALYVMVGARTGRVDWGRKPSGFDQPVGNLLVHYGGGNATTLAEVKAAVGALRGS